MKLKVIVEADCQLWHGGAAMEVPDPLYKAFEPLKTTDDVMAAVATGDLLATSAAAQIVIKFREESAKEIAQVLTNHLLRAMRSQYTFNGYSIAENEEVTGGPIFPYRG